METKCKWVVTVGLDLNGQLQAGHKIYDTFVDRLSDYNLNVELKQSGTVGLSPGETVVVVSSGREQWLYPCVTQEQVETIVVKHLIGGNPITDWAEPVAGRFNVPLLAQDIKTAVASSSEISPAKCLVPRRGQKGRMNYDYVNTTDGPGLGHGVEAGEGYRWIDVNLIGLGWSIGLAILLGVLGGFWLDNLLDTRPLFTLIGLGLGLAIAAFSAYRLLAQVTKPGRQPVHQAEPKLQLKDVVDEVAKARQESDQHIEEIHHNGWASVELAVARAKDRQTHTPTEPTSEEDFITQAKARIAQDKAEAIARLRREYEHLTATSETDYLSARPEDNQKPSRDAGGSSD